MRLLLTPWCVYCIFFTGAEKKNISLQTDSAELKVNMTSMENFVKLPIFLRLKTNKFHFCGQGWPANKNRVKEGVLQGSYGFAVI